MSPRRGTRISPGGLILIVVLVLVGSFFLLGVKKAPLGFQSLYDNKLDRHYIWYQRQCLNVKEEPNFYELGVLLSRWGGATDPRCREVLRLFEDIYTFERRFGSVELPDSFAKKVRGWLNNDEELFAETKSQLVFSLFNQYTHESTLFSKLRSKRPGLVGRDDPRKYAEKLGEDAESSCDFCRYRERTAFDSFGRIESEYAVVVSNVFKYEKFHGLVLLKRHSPPIDFSEVEFLDMMNVMEQWYLRAYNSDKRFRFPNLNWDMLPRASASQVHPHAQAALAPSHSYGLMEHIHLSAQEFQRQHGGANYFTAIQEVHNAFGLATVFGNATALAYLTPKKDFEIMVLSRSPCRDFYRLIYFVLRAFVDDMNLVSFSMGMYLPPVDHWYRPSSDDLPAIARIISRGSVSSTRSDISAMELFGASQVNQNPHLIMSHVRNSIRNRSNPSR